MRFVETKTPELQSCLMLHRTRQLFIRQQVGHCHVNRKFAGQMTMAATVHAATVAWRHVSIA